MDNAFDGAKLGMEAYLRQMGMTDRNENEAAQQEFDEDPLEEM